MTLTVLVGFAVIALVLWSAKSSIDHSPGSRKHLFLLGGAVFALLIGGLLALTGKTIYGLPLLFIGATVLAKTKNPGFRLSLKNASIVRRRTAMLAMAIDRTSGAMRGSVLAGRYAHKNLDALSEYELVDLAREVSARDQAGFALLEAYLDGRVPGWRVHLQGDAHPGGRHAAGQSAMTEDEAYQILGLDPGAGAAEISAAHRALMKKLHPDQGGSTYLASRVNQAKDVLFRTQR